ncbi:MAG: peptide ABC transporter substrate-binding protein [Anaerolineae bacterium]|nr:peptide ABC transporter substrate-binding protein [Anaerolineae bacterium]MDW8102037.1 peptide ABC transporter substrate-binding protein [Anaerolineae bacterium]
MQSKTRFFTIVLIILASLCCATIFIGGGFWAIYRYYVSREGITPSPVAVTPQPGGVLRIAGFEPVTLDPALVEDIYSAEYVTKIFSGLVTLNEFLEVAPDLAERWEVSGDGTVYTFYLRKNAYFHNGKPVTAEDVKYSLERACDPATGSHTAGIYLDDIKGVKEKLAGEAPEIEGVEVLDQYTLRISIDAPKAYFLAKLTYPVAFVVDKENVESGSDWTSRPNGTGPFKLKSYDPEKGITLETFANFYGQKPLIEQVEFIFPEGSPFVMYQTGEIDVTPVGVENIEQVLDPQNPMSKELMKVSSLDLMYVAFNVKKEPFEDPDVRKAFACATDRASIVKALFKGMVKEAKGILPPGMPGYTEKAKGLVCEPSQAMDFLKRSSYGGPEGLPSITLSVSGSTALAQALVEMYKNSLEVAVEIEQIPWDLFLREVNEHKLQMFILGWSADYPDPHNFLDIHFHSQSPGNNTGYSNPEVDRLLEEARVEKDHSRRMALYQQAEDLILKDAPWVPLFHGVDYILVKPYVREFVVSPIGTLYLNKTYISR